MTDPPGGPTVTDAATGAQPVPDEPAVAAPEPAQPAPLRSQGSPRLPWIIAAVATLLAIGAGIFGAVTYVRAADLSARESARESAKEAGEIVALQISTVDGAQIDQWLAQTKSLATGKFAEDLARGYDEDLRAEFRQSKVRTVGEVIQSFVQSASDDEAVAFVIVRQTTSRPGAEGTIEDELRMEVTLQRQNERWLASDVAVLTPTPPLQQPSGG